MPRKMYKNDIEKRNKRQQEAIIKAYLDRKELKEAIDKLCIITHDSIDVERVWDLQDALLRKLRWTRSPATMGLITDYLASIGVNKRQLGGIRLYIGIKLK